MVYDKVYHIALTEQEFNLLQLIQAGNRFVQSDDITPHSIPESSH